MRAKPSGTAFSGKGGSGSKSVTDEMTKVVTQTFQVETVYQLLDALYREYPDGAASMPESIGEAVINVLCELDQFSLN